MRQLLFLIKVAFICNIIFLITVAIHFIPVHSNNDLLSTLIIIGLILAPCINTIVNLMVGYLFLFQQKKLNTLPFWLCISNAVFWVLQLTYILLPI